MTFGRLLELILSLVLGALSVVPAGAQTPDTKAQQVSPNDQRARMAFQLGAQAYAEGRYEAAAELFEESYRLSGRTVLLINLANVYERLGRLEDAVQSLEAFLRSNPESERRAVVETRAANLRRRIRVVRERSEAAELERQNESAPAQEENAAAEILTPQPPSDGTDPVLITGGILAGVGVAALGVAVVTGAMADSTDDDISSCVTVEGQRFCSVAARDDLDRAEALATTTDVLWISGTVVAVGGIVLIVAALAGKAPEEDIQAIVRPGEAGFAIRF